MRSSTRKLKPILKSIVGKNVDLAIRNLSFSDKRISNDIKKKPLVKREVWSTHQVIQRKEITGNGYEPAAKWKVIRVDDGNTGINTLSLIIICDTLL